MTARLCFIRASNHLASVLDWLGERLTLAAAHLRRCENCGGRTYYAVPCFGKPPK